MISQSSWIPAWPALKRLTPAIAASLLVHAAFAVGISPFIGSAVAHDDDKTPALLVQIADATPMQKPALQKPAKTPASATVGDGSTQKKKPLPGTYYFKRSELDQPPGTFNDIAPIYPATADPNGGHIVARIFINEDGKADKVVIEEATPAGQFEKSVMDAFGKAQYRPGMKNGKDVKSQMKIDIVFYPVDAPKASTLPAPSTKMFKVPTNPDYPKK